MALKMNTDVPIQFFASDQKPKDDYAVFDVTIPIDDDTLSFRFGALDCQATLTDLVTPAWQLCDAIVADTLERLSKKGIAVSCKAKCSKCCSYIVPSIAPEAFMIDEHIASMSPECREAVLRNTLAAIEKIQANNFTAAAPGDDKSLENTLSDLSEWYKDLNIACPFLIDQQCAIYDKRPLVCRELLTLSDASTCDKETPDSPESVKLPVSIAEALIKTCDKLDETAGGIILLALIIPWCQTNAHLAQKTWPAKKLVKLFIESIDESITKVIKAEDI